MKYSNFASRHTSTSSQIVARHKAASIVLVSVVTILVSITCKLAYSVWHLHAEHTELSTYLAGQKENITKSKQLADQQKELQTRWLKLNSKDQFPQEYFKLIAQAIPAHAKLTEISYRKNNGIHLKGIARNSQSLTEFIRALTDLTHFNKAKVTEVKQGSHNELLYQIRIEL